MKKFVKKILSLSLVLVLLISLNACGKDAENKTDSNNNAGESSNEKVQITFWHSMGGAGGKGIKTMVEKFNSTQDKIEVVEQFQGDYDEAINKLKSATKGKAGPDVVQIYDIGTQYMIESGHVIPMQEFIDKDNFDINLLEDNILAYYNVDGELYSMPFNSSTPLLYYNKDMLKEAGIENPPETIDEIIAASKKIAKDNKTGMALGIYGWFFEQWMSKQGLPYANNGNGREERATAVDFDKNQGGLNVAKAWKRMIDSKVIKSFPSTGDARSAFVAGQAGMTLESTAALAGILKEVGGKFEVGTAYYPKINADDNGGVSIGGGSLWILDNSDDAKKDAAWEFIKFMVSPEQQVYWHKTTGYFPINKDSYKLDEMKKHLDENPQFKTAIDQLRDTKGEYAGALLPVFPEARKIIESELENMITNGKSPEDMIKDSAKLINESIEKYIQSNK